MVDKYLLSCVPFVLLESTKKTCPLRISICDRSGEICVMSTVILGTICPIEIMCSSLVCSDPHLSMSCRYFFVLVQTYAIFLEKLSCRSTHLKHILAVRL